MKKITILLSIILLLTEISFTQVAINNDGSFADSSAILELKSTSRGFLPPRMTTAERDAISSPAEGLTIYNTSSKTLEIYNGVLWTSPVATFVCGNQIQDTDGNIYNTIQIGSRCWMAENLNTGIMTNGFFDQYDDNITNKYCYDNDTNNCNTYGGLYQWGEMMQYVTTEGARGICPNGWHIPTDAEWKTMEMHIGLTEAQANSHGWRGTNEGDKLKEAGFTHWVFTSTNATNSSGFTALPGGIRMTNQTFFHLQYEANFWTSSNTSEWNAYFRHLYYSKSKVFRMYENKNSGYSVRCIKD